MRIATMNILGGSDDWPRRLALVRDGLCGARPDLVALQETVTLDGHDQVADLIAGGYRVHQARRGPNGVGMSLVSRWPIAASHEFDLLVSPRVDSRDWLESLLAVVVDVPEPIGRVVFASPKPSYQRGYEHERELQAIAAARHLERLASRYGGHVVLGSDFDAVPTAASMRFWRGVQSLGGLSVAYCDAWETAHPTEAGHPSETGVTFDPQNPLVRGHWRQDAGRRIDYILIRCDDHGPTLRVRSCSRLLDDGSGGWASDHYGVLAELDVL